MVDADYVPLAAVQLVVPPKSKEAAALVASAIAMARVDDVDQAGGLERLDRATSRLKRAVRAFERRATQ